MQAPANPPPGLPAPAPEASSAPLQVALVYTVCSALWILFSDRALAAWLTDPTHFALASAVKGWLFTGVTALLLYGLLRRRAAAADAAAAGLAGRLAGGDGAGDGPARADRSGPWWGALPRKLGTRLLLVGKNFGCGSSREHAVWALMEFGIEAIIAPSFAPIFKGNCIRNGLLPIELPVEVVRGLAWQMVSIDLADQTVSAGGESWHFPIDAEAKAMLLEGLDAIDLTLKMKSAIARWLGADRRARPWAYLEKSK